MRRPLHVLLLFSLPLFVSHIPSPFAQSSVNPLAGSQTAVAEGRVLFGQLCQSCHGPAGEGAGDRGPALNSGTFTHGSADADLFRAIRSGIRGTQMVPFGGLSDTQVWQLVAYLRSLDPAARAGVAPASGAGDASAGEALFFGRAGCASCHEVNARGGIVGPDLSNAGRLSQGVLQAKITSPNSSVAATGGRRGAAPATVTVKTLDGREIRGVRRNEDTFSLQMIDLSGQLRLLDKSTLASVIVEGTSLHPADYAARLSNADVANLVAYLGTLRGRDMARTAAAPPVPGGVTYERLLNAKAEPHNWLMYWGDYQGTHYSSLKSIDTSNVTRLRVAWSAPVPGDTISESTPLVVDGVMYATSGGNTRTVTAMDARTGRQIWRYTRQQKVRNPGETDVVNRGVAILGHRLFVGTNDAALVCLDARTGLLLWEVQVADTMEGFNITSPPLVVKDKIIVGHAGGEYAIRGFLDAYDVTGTRLWRCYTIPGPGEFGNDTWKGDSWKTGGGGTWLTGTYDAALDTLYWPIGNPAPMTDRSVRARPRHRPAQVALSVHAQRRPRLGLDGRHGARRSAVARPPAPAAAPRGSKRPFLRARSRHRRIPVGHAVRLSELEQGLRCQRAADARSRIEFESRRELPRLSIAGRRDELPGAVLQPDHRIVLCGVFGSRCALRQRAAGRREGEGVARQRAQPGRAAAARSERSGAERGHQGDRSGHGKDRVGLQTVPGLAGQRRARNRRRPAVRVVT
jgi:putative heme-binding domain-containing protein